MGNLRVKTIKYLIPLTLSLSFLIGCQKKPVEEISCAMPEWASENSNYVSNPTLDIAVHVDGSDSMLGYVTIPNSNYTRTIEVLSNSIIGTSNVNVTYHRIGDEKNITRDDFRKIAKSTTFYDSNDGTYKPVSSPIQSAIIPPPQGKEKLTVIVTDLEGDDAGRIAEALSKNYLNEGRKNYTIGVWAVKSQFNGTVFNPNTGSAKFIYNTQGKSSEAYRPFYVLFIGEYDKIIDSFNEIKKLDSQLQSYSEMFIFPSQNILKEAVNLGNFSTIERNSVLPETGDLQRIYSLTDDNVVVIPKDQNQDTYDLIEVINPTEMQPKINYSVAFPQLATNDNNNYSLFINENNLITQTKVFTYGKNNRNIEEPELEEKEEETNAESTEAKEESQKSTANNQENNTPLENTQEKQNFIENSSNTLRQALIIDNLKLDEQKQNLEFVTNLNLNNLSNPQIYLFEVDLILDDVTSLDWWNNWSVNAGEVGDGSKTQNLSIFMNKLKSLSLETLENENGDAVIGRFCIGIQKN
ncbi:hypothetical protein H6G11_17300 [Cyanobacterium aponinum FACHB-4101]|uniref:hypothetical protein n=1 Tax=Cyanobacterium aponinum TaxID=379064 RepID=UPI001680D458|nr:hypothetical protein [Cyanobacterium aponinum]MBD2396004.1 hypothetical protein [Cyanobacterium aponinum FACHB-4101]